MKGFLFVILATFLWAADSIIRYPLLVRGVTASVIVFWEHIFLVVIMSPFLLKVVKKVWGSSVRELTYFMFIGIFGSAIATLAFTEAFSLINPSLVILLQKLQPLVAITLAHFVLKERIGRKFIIWGVVCFLGGFLISYNDLALLWNVKWTLESLFSMNSFRGYMLALLAVVGWGAATVFGKKLSNSNFNAKEIMTGRFTMGLLVLIPINIFSTPDTLAFEFSMDILSKILLMVALSGLLGMYFYYRGLKLLSARVCTLAEMAFPLCAVTVNWIFLGAQLTPLQIVGGCLLLLGSTVIQLKHY